ncbi:MAG: antibiotic biosynthesis monooxygenase [Hydrogenothermaceae bacterium]|nr:antibiotic biosynthesis monooxygenase [Hydrogenothermaceae bacterium]
MILVLTRFSINSEYREEFEKRAVEKFGEHGIDQIEGFMGMKVLGGKSFPSMPQNDSVIVITYWKDMDSFLNYTKSDAFAKAHQNPPPKEMLKGSPSVEVYKVIKEI